jgi:leucyl-tRNA synthetase
MLFAGPVEDDVDWATVSAAGVHKWLGRVFRAVGEAAARGGASADAGEIPADPRTAGGPEQNGLVRLLHRTRKAATADYDRFRFNIAVAKLMTLTNGLVRALDAGAAGGEVLETASTLAQLIGPLAPHLAEELWRETLGHGESVFASTWPEWDEALTRLDEVTLVVQVDGKVRDRITVPADAGEDRCRELALESTRVKSSLDGRAVERVIVRPPKLVNIVTRP